MPEPAPTALRREIGLFGAMMLGLGSIVGTGVFVSLGLGAETAGPGLLLAIFLAALVAACNGLSSAELAANHPVSGGTYEYAYRWLSPSLGFTAGWLFLAAKSASAATAALGFAGYLLRAFTEDPQAWARPVAWTALLVLTLIALAGIRRSSLANLVIVTVTLLALAFFVIAGSATAWVHAGQNLGAWPDQAASGFSGLLSATALMFVAYTGYGRLATLGEEVREPRRTIPLAVIATLLVSLFLYASVALVALASVGAAEFAEATRRTAAPLEVIAAGFGVPGAPVILAVGAMTAMLGVLLNLLLGLSRVLLAMGRRGDMPRALASISPARGVPWVATLVVALVIGGLVLLGDVRLTWSFSAFTVLIYYALTNLCVLRMPRAQRLFPVWPAYCGLAACAGLAFWVDVGVWLAGTGLIGLGLLWHRVARRLQLGSRNQ